MIAPLEETANQLMRQLINQIVGQNEFAIRANQNAPRPQGPYATVTTSSIDPIGWEEWDYVNRVEDVDIDHNIKGMRNFVFSIGFYRDNAKDFANQVLLGLVKNSSTDLLNQAKFGLGLRSGVTSFSEPLESGYEQRAQIDVTLNTVATDTDLIRSIQSVTITGDYQSNGKSQPITIEVK